MGLGKRTLTQHVVMAEFKRSQFKGHLDNTAHTTTFLILTKAPESMISSSTGVEQSMVNRKADFFALAFPPLFVTVFCVDSAAYRASQQNLTAKLTVGMLFDDT